MPVRKAVGGLVAAARGATGATRPALVATAVERIVVPWESPDMTAEYADGCYVDESAMSAADRQGWKAFNSGLAYPYNWHAAATSGWVRLWLPHPVSLDFAEITVISHPGGVDSVAPPKRYKYQGSQDGSTWVDLAPEQSTPTATTAVVYPYTFAAPTEFYRYLRVQVLEGWSTTYIGLGYVRFIGRMELYP